EFYQLGFDTVAEISSEHGTGVGDLLDHVVDSLERPAGRPSADAAIESQPQTHSDALARTEIGVAIVGRPNVGKSSLVNRLLREERMLVSERPGTTRDPIDSVLTWHRRRFRIVDTAGMRRPGRVRSGGRVELVSVSLASRAIAEADVVALMIDAREGAT